MNEHPVRWWNYLLLVTPPLFVGAVFLMSVLMRHSFDVYLVVSFFVGAGIASIAGLGNMPKRLGVTPVWMRILFTSLAWVLVALYFYLAIGPLGYWSIAYATAGGGFLGAILAPSLLFGPALFSAGSLTLNRLLDEEEVSNVVFFFLFLVGGWFLGAIFLLAVVILGFIILSVKAKRDEAPTSLEPKPKDSSSDDDDRRWADTTYCSSSYDSSTSSDDEVEETVTTYSIDGREATTDGYGHWKDDQGHGF
jgi:hypothetical protein